MERELRFFDLSRAEVRAAEDGSKTFIGHAAVFNSLSQELWGFYERVAPSAFQRAEQGKDDVRALFNHNPDLILARTKSGTLDLAADSEGLLAQFGIPDTSYGRDLAISLERKDVD